MDISVVIDNSLLYSEFMARFFLVDCLLNSFDRSSRRFEGSGSSSVLFDLITSIGSSSSSFNNVDLQCGVRFSDSCSFLRRLELGDLQIG